MTDLDPYDLHLSCKCGRALLCYEDYDPELGVYLVYAASNQDAAQYHHEHDIAIVRTDEAPVEWTVYEGKCQ